MADELVSVTGADGIHRVYKALKAAGEGGGLGRELTRSIRLATKPAKDALKASAQDTLPRRGGLGALIGRSRVTTVVTRGSQSAGVTIKVADPHDIRKLDEGALRHPVFGHRPWVSQPVRAGWFSTPLGALAPDITLEIDKALAATAAKIAGK